MIRKFGVAAAMAVLSALPAWAQTAAPAAAPTAPATQNVPVPWQMGLQPAATERMADIISLHFFVLVIITAICLFVLALLVWIAIRYNSRSNPVPSTTTHNTTLEVAWTVIPVLILVAIAIPSFRLLYFEDTIPKADLTIKAIGRQWYWSYEYPDNGNFTFDSRMLDAAKAQAAGDQPILSTDNHVVVPVGETIRVLTTGADVIHSWAVPAFGVKIDAVPGRINETWFKAEREGVFYGQCSELCGASHSYMPIEVEVVSKERYAQWVAEARHKFANADGTQDQTRLADVR